MNYKLSKLNGYPILLNHQHFIYFDDEQELKTTIDSWPALQVLSFEAHELLSIMRDIALEEGMSTISRNSVSKKAQGIAKDSAHLNELLYFLRSKGYLNFQKGGVYGHKQFIALNPDIFIQKKRIAIKKVEKSSNCKQE